MAIVIGVDSSTQSTTVQVRDTATGALVAEGRAPHPATTPPRSEQDPESWWSALIAAMADARSADPRTADASALSVAGQQHGLVATDIRGHPLRAAKLWNDTESSPQANRLVSDRGAAWWADRTGLVPVASFTITKLCWLADNEPDVYDRIERVLLPHDWLTYRLCGEFVTDRGDASGTGYFDPVRGTWATDVLDDLPRRRIDTSTLPRIGAPAEVAGSLTAAAAEALGLRAGMAVACGTGDNMAAALGLGLQPGDVALSLGTSGTIYSVALTATHDHTGAVAGFCDANGQYLPLVATLNATKVTDTFARLAGLDRDTFASLALESSSDGVVLVPYLDGERTPNRPDANGALSGITTATTPGQVARAAHEGVVCGLLDGLAALNAAGVTSDGTIVLTGGGAQSVAYRQIVADLADQPVRVGAGTDHVALGAAMQAAATVEGNHDLVRLDWLTQGDIIDPTPGTTPHLIRSAYAAQVGGDPDHGEVSSLRR